MYIFNIVIRYYKYMQSAHDPELKVLRKQLLEEVFDFQDRLKFHSVWGVEPEPLSDEEDLPGFGGPLYQRRRYPRFLAVLEDPVVYCQFEQEADLLQTRMKDLGVSTRWTPTFFPEVWSYATVRVRQAAMAYRGMGDPLISDPQERLCGRMPLRGQPVRIEEWSEALLEPLRAAAERLELSGLPIVGWTVSGQVDDKLLFGTPVLVLELSEPITVRRSSGRSFRLYGVATTGAQHKDVKIGMVVLHGLETPVQMNPPRKPRADTKTPVANEMGWSFYL